MGDLVDPDRLEAKLKEQGIELAALALALDWNGAEESENERIIADNAIALLERFPGAVLNTVQIPTGRHDLAARQKSLVNIVNTVSARANTKGIPCSFHPNSPHSSIIRTEEDYKIVLESLGILRSHVMSALKSQGLNAHAVSASDFSSQADWVRAVREAFDAGPIPLFHGDIVSWGEERIVSTEDLIALLPMPRAKIIFLMDEEGVLKDGKVLSQVRKKDFLHIDFFSENKDVTGGMSHKLETAFELAKTVPVTLLSGLIPRRFYQELIGENTVKTEIIA